MKPRHAAALALVFISSGLVIAQSEPVIAKIQIVGNYKVSMSVIQARISSHTGEPLDPDTVSRDIKAIYATGKFERVVASIQGNTLIYTVVEKPN
jgi:outer membrane protein assembly factor BamA